MRILQSYKLAAVTALLFTGSAVLAQNGSTGDQAPGTSAVNNSWQPSLVRDGVYDRVPHINQALVWQPIREADILWKKRVWREIDTREKKNVAFRYPGDENTGGGFFIEIIIDAIKKGKIKAYSGFGDDRFTSALTKEQLNELISGKTDTQYVINPDNGEQVMKIIHTEFNPDAVSKFRLKEDWIFDRNQGEMIPRIVGLAPYKDILNDDGSYRASQPLFWLYYPDIRQLLAQYEVFNPDNDVARMTWDEFFETRQFSSRIIKVSNPFDTQFRDGGVSPIEALYKGERAGEDIFNKEHDMWVY